MIVGPSSRSGTSTSRRGGKLQPASRVESIRRRYGCACPVQNLAGVARPTITDVVANDMRLSVLQCDGSRPTCSTCLRRGSDCRFEAEPKETHVQALRRKYETLQEKRSAQQQVCELLRTRPEAEALSIFRRLREGDSPEVVMRHVQHGDLLLQLSLRSESEQQSETSSSEPPSGQGHGVLVSAGDAEHPHRGTLLYGATSALSSVVPSPATANARDQTATGALRDGLGLKTLPFSRQNVECDVVEPLIDKVRPCRWTSVVAEDEVMRSLLNLFFQLEYRWFHVPVFHKDSFLRDMASEIPENCSSLLVNAVLACACVGSSLLVYCAPFLVFFCCLKTSLTTCALHRMPPTI